MRKAFQPTSRKEYLILRDYYVSNNHLQGIYFVLYDEKNNTIVNKFLKRDLIQNDGEWKKKGMLFNRRYHQLRIEKGTKREYLLIEQGNLIFEKEDSKKMKKAERITFYLLANNQQGPPIAP